MRQITRWLLLLQIVILTGCTVSPAGLAVAALPPPLRQPAPPAQSAIDPLTGLPADPAMLDRRPVMVKVSNYPVVGRPHAGLSAADMVFEYYIGEYVNRFMAVYYSQDAEQIGPVRSGRLVDVQLARMYGSMLAYGSADERVDEVIKDYLGGRALAHTESPCPPICGFDPHSAAGTFADSGALTDYLSRIGVDNARPDLSGMVFDPTPPAGDQMAVQLGVQYSVFNRGEWRFDPASGKYLRWIEEYSDETNSIKMIPLVDRNNDQQLAFSNVIVLFAFYVEYNRTLHNIDIWNNQTGQRAVFFRDGVMTEGQWRAVDKERPLQFFTPDGAPYALKPGNTWIVIAGLSSTFDQPNPGQWETYFYLP